MNELFNSADPQTECDPEIKRVADQLEPKSASKIPCRRSARISAAKENGNGTLLLNAYKYIISASLNKKTRKARANSARRRTAKKVTDPCDCQEKFSMSSKRLRSQSHSNNASPATENECDQPRKDDEVTAVNLAHGSADNNAVSDKKDKVDDRDEIFKCVKMKTESKTNSDLKMKIKKCYKKSKRKEPSGDLNRGTISDNGKAGVPNESGKRRKRETCRKQFRHKDITLYKLGSGPEKGFAKTKHEIQKLFIKCPTSDGLSKEATDSFLTAEKDVSSLLQSFANENSGKLTEEKLDTKLLEPEGTPCLTKAVHEETSNKYETTSKPNAIPELRIFDDSSKSSIELTDIKTNKPETGKHNLPIRIPERRSSIAQPLRPTSSRAEVNFSVENMVESNSSTSIESNGKILHRPYQSVESAKSTSSDEDRPPQVVPIIADITNEELPGLVKRCSGITDPLKVKENHLPLQKTSVQNDSKHQKLSSPQNVKMTVSHDIVPPLQSMPRLDFSEERIPDKVSPTLNASNILKRKLSPERDKVPSAKQSKEERPSSYNFPFINPPLYNFLPTFAEYNRYLRAPHFEPRVLTPYEPYNTHPVRNPNSPQSNFYSYDYVKSLLRYSKQDPSHSPVSSTSTGTISPTVIPNVPKTKETAILTIPVVRAASKKLGEESHEDEDLNAQTLSKIINNEHLSVTKLSPNVDFPKLDVGKKESGATLELEILRKELIKPTDPPKISSSKATLNEVSKVEPGPNSPLYVISDSETETDNETELEAERNRTALNLTKVNSAVNHKPAARILDTPSEKKRIAHTLNTLTFVVNEIIDKSGGNMEKQDKDMLHKLLKGVRQNFELNSAENDETSPVVIKQENVIEIVSSDSEDSTSGKDETVQQCLDLSKTTDFGKESGQGSRNQSATNSPSVANGVVVSLVSPNTHATNTAPEVAAPEEMCGIDLSLRRNQNCVEEAHREVNNNKAPLSISPVRANVEAAITRNASPCRALETLQTVSKNKASSIDTSAKKESVITNPSPAPARPIVARRASYHPPTTTPKLHPNLSYKDTTYHNASGNIELSRPTYQTNRNPINNPQDSDPSSNLSTNLMKTFVCEYLRGGSNQNQTQYSRSAPVTPKTTTSHPATNHFTYTNNQSMQALQEYTNGTAYQAWQEELRRRRVAHSQYYANSNERAQPNVNLNKPMNYNGGNPYLQPSQALRVDSTNPYGANMPKAEHHYGAYGNLVNGNVLAPNTSAIPPKNQATNKVSGQFSYGPPNYGYFRRRGPPPKPYPNYNPTKPPPTLNQKQQQTHQFAGVNLKKPESFLSKGRLREALLNDNASPDYGYYSPQTKAATTIDGAQYGAYPQNIERRRPSASSQHSSISALENPFSEHLHANSNSSSTTSIGSVNNNPEPPPQTFSQISKSNDQAILSKILPKLQASDQPLTPEQYVREMNILEIEGCPKKLLEFYAYVTKKQIASNQRPISFGIFLEFQRAGKLTVFEDAFKLYIEKRQIEKF